MIDVAPCSAPTKYNRASPSTAAKTAQGTISRTGIRSGTGLPEGTTTLATVSPLGVTRPDDGGQRVSLLTPERRSPLPFPPVTTVATSGRDFSVTAAGPSWNHTRFLHTVASMLICPPETPSFLLMPSRSI